MQLKETKAEMKAALQLIHLSHGDSNDGDNSKVVTVKEEEKESNDVYRMKKRKFRSISSLYQDTDAGSGSKLPIRDEEDHRLKKGKPKKRKFHSISDLYKYTDRLSSVEDEYNWSIPAGENPNMNISIKEDSGIGTNKKNAEMYNDYSEMNIAMLGPISKFILSIVDPVDFRKIDNLIYFLSRSGIQHLVLQLPRDNLYKMPSSFFTCLQLRHLTLQRCLVRPPPVFKDLIGKHDVAEFFKSIPALEHLHWDYSNFRFMFAGPAEVPKVLPSSLNCLKRLYLSEICLEELVEVAWALCLIRSSPYLEELQIKGPGDLFGEWLAHVPPGGVNEIPASFSDLT
ncbi:hypothetical protein RND71_041427 [Anisodus tanguticus]|uniref:FBD domain-containing protein n=1 Tax=Anisodus tanguticus TaxID=243964 RepID=A0AAE1QUK1_9SOLA|nr:hypothetical protein RND71_041427 [Anisodus tanguticus]